LTQIRQRRKRDGKNKDEFGGLRRRKQSHGVHWHQHAPLSHAAIVAREMGIPAVVGCGNATMFLKTGDRVRVDGGAGSVEVIERAS